MAHPPRITFFLDQQVNRLLILARADDRVPAAERIRAALRLWHGDPELRRRIDELAGTLRRTRLAAPPSDAQLVKLTFSLEPELLQALALARAEDRIPAVERIRAALQLWNSDTSVHGQVDQLAVILFQSRRGTPLPAPPDSAADLWEASA